MTAQKAVDALQAVWLQRETSGNNEEAAKQAYAKFKEVETEAKKAKDEVGKAKLEVEKAEAKVEKATEAARASVQAGRGQAGLLHVQLLLLPLICTPAWSSCVFVGVTVVAFWGHALISARIPSSSSCLHCVHWGLFGVEGLLAASGFTKNCGCTCFTAWKRHLCGSGKGVMQIFLHLVSLPMLRTGCQS